MTLLVVCWRWGNKFGHHYVDRLRGGVRRHLRQQHQFVEHVPPWHQLLWEKGCLVRLQMFGREWQEHMGLRVGDRILSLDLDLVVTGSLDELLLGHEQDELTIVQDINSTNPCPFNGSMFMFTAGTRHDVWDDFSIENYAKRGVPFHSFPDDQGWLHHKFPSAGAWRPEDGVYGFKKKGWPAGDDLPENARVVAFPGWRDPQRFSGLPWIKEHWR